jgi:hypothetical protein
MDSTDDALVAELRRIADEVDPVPDVVSAAARAAITTRDLDRELAVLVGDSAAYDSTETAMSGAFGFDPVRAGPADATAGRLLAFAGGGVTVDLEVSGQSDQLTLLGQLSGAAAEPCTLEYADGSRREVPLDDVGRFVVSGVRGGLVRLRCRSASGRPVVTDWVTV